MTGVSDFRDQQHSVAELAFQGAEELDLEKTCNAATIAMLDDWHKRPDPHVSGAEMFQLEHCPRFSMSYQGDAGEYWPDEAENDIVETLIRDFLYCDGICSLKDDRVRLVHMKYNIMALAGDEYVLICPYLTEANNIAGILVICVTKVMK
ncbi:MAG: hypothetical protein R3192_08510 [Woeseiaceae bacterium]|nr:hypothetical protein [Woeseiaceae bacterium]